MNRDNEGFSVRNIPSQRIKVCHGCKYLETHPMMRGHKSVTDNYVCKHPDFYNDRPVMSGDHGRTIHFNHEGECTTPEWCPFLNVKKEGKIL